MKTMLDRVQDALDAAKLEFATREQTLERVHTKHTELGNLHNATLKELWQLRDNLDAAERGRDIWHRSWKEATSKVVALESEVAQLQRQLEDRKPPEYENFWHRSGKAEREQILALEAQIRDLASDLADREAVLETAREHAADSDMLLDAAKVKLHHTAAAAIVTAAELARPHWAGGTPYAPLAVSCPVCSARPGEFCAGETRSTYPGSSFQIDVSSVSIYLTRWDAILGTFTEPVFHGAREYVIWLGVTPEDAQSHSGQGAKMDMLGLAWPCEECGAPEGEPCKGVASDQVHNDRMATARGIWTELRSSYISSKVDRSTEMLPKIEIGKMVHMTSVPLYTFTDYTPRFRRFGHED